VNKLFSCLQVWEDDSSRTSAGQMACDEAMAWQSVRPVLRVYRWGHAAATFGYSQRVDGLPEKALTLGPVRRWTGGGVVFHGDDLTLALVVPATESLAQLRAAEMYKAIHEAIAEVLRRTIPSARLVLPEECRSGGVCFQSPVQYDIMAGPLKICGGALRRFRKGILYQGSLHFDGIAGGRLAEGLARKVDRFTETGLVELEVVNLECTKYGTHAWRNLR
jgi:lipoyl(octanoyl) transferase